MDYYSMPNLFLGFQYEEEGHDNVIETIIWSNFELDGIYPERIAAREATRRSFVPGKECTHETFVYQAYDRTWVWVRTVVYK